ncbi:MAG: YegP family protein [Chthoniobacterales bacterium]|nr:YegP family protein [Chthoniobacterales bacterium]
MQEPKFEIWNSEKNGQWYWRFKAGNGQTIATGGEGYSGRRDALRAISRLQASHRSKIYSLTPPTVK